MGVHKTAAEKKNYFYNTQQIFCDILEGNNEGKYFRICRANVFYYLLFFATNL